MVLLHHHKWRIIEFQTTLVFFWKQKKWKADIAWVVFCKSISLRHHVGGEAGGCFGWLKERGGENALHNRIYCVPWLPLWCCRSRRCMDYNTVQLCLKVSVKAFSSTTQRGDHIVRWMSSTPHPPTISLKTHHVPCLMEENVLSVLTYCSK